MRPNDLPAALEPFKAEMMEVRHALHRHPEVGFEEVRTAALVAAKLRGFGLEVAEGIGGTGVVATLRGAWPGARAIALRADLDALHIQEVPGRPHGSEVPGKMHACGHDGHTAMLLGAARYLSANRDGFGGEAVFIFQPAEEGLGGAKRMIEEGLFERYPVDAVYGMHNMPGVPAGEFRTRTGPFMAASDTWSVAFSGTGGHGGAGAHLSTDPTLAASHFILALQTVVSRNVPAIETAVVSVGALSGGDPNSPNIIPPLVTVTGTARSYRPEVRDLIERRLGEIAAAQGACFGCDVEVRYDRRYPPVVTHAEQTAISAAAAADLVGAAKVDADAAPMTGAEDFSFMLEAKPGGFIFIGNGTPADGKLAGLHTPDYDFNDDILPIGAAYWVSLVQAELGRGL